MNEILIGGMGNKKFKDAAFYNRDKGRVWYPEGTAPTFRSTDYKDPVKIMVKRSVNHGRKES